VSASAIRYHQGQGSTNDPIHKKSDSESKRTFLPKILQLLLRLRHPKGIFVQHLEPREHELRLRGAGRAFADLVREAEGFGDGEETEDGVEGRAFFEGFGEDVAAAAG